MAVAPRHPLFAELDQYVGGRLPPTDHAAVDSHVQYCRECAQFTSESRLMISVLMVAAATLDKPEL
jgi:anti-sigma factor RsiW